MSIHHIRAHHGLCTAFFRGYGYSDGFSKNMQTVIEMLNTDNPPVLICKEADEICHACPNREGNQCRAFAKPNLYDSRVFEFCGLEAGTVLSWKEFRSLVFEKIILPGRRKEVCGDCEWNDLCENIYF